MLYLHIVLKQKKILTFLSLNIILYKLKIEMLICITYLKST